MAIIISLYAAVLALAVWQEDAGSDHAEKDLGSERQENSRHCPRC